MTEETTQAGAEDGEHADTTVDEVVNEAELHDEGSANLDPNEPEEGDEGSPDDGTEIELDGDKYKVPQKLKDAFMRTTDYSQKTMELAEQRRALEAERVQLSDQAESRMRELLSDHVKVTQLEETVTYYKTVDWDRVEEENPDLAAREWRKYQQAQMDLGSAKQELQTKQEGRLKEKQGVTAQALQETGRILARDIPGWSKELAVKLMETATAFGVTHEEIASETDHRVWKLLHAAHVGAQHLKKQATTTRAVQTAATAPIKTVGAKAPPPSPLSDKAATDAWMKARQEQVRKGR